MSYSEVDAMCFDTVLDIAPQLAFSQVRLETRASFSEDCSWVGLTCCQRPEGIFYRVGPRHHYLMLKNGKKWAVMRAGTVIRLLVKKLAREVAA